MDEFAIDINFKYGVPVIILDIIAALTGYDILSEVRKFITPPKYIERMNPDDERYRTYLDSINEEYHDLVFDIFDQLGELDCKKI